MLGRGSVRSDLSSYELLRADLVTIAAADGDGIGCR